MITLHHLVFGKKYAQPIPTDYILAYDFNGDFLDKSANLNHAVNNGVTFTTGRKLGTQCANFNGSAFLETANNLIFGSNKVTISLWLKSSQTTPSFILESGNPYDISSIRNFCLLLNWNIVNEFEFVDYDGNYNLKTNTQGFANWTHYIATLDRSLTGVNEIKVFRNLTENYASTLAQGDHSSNFTNQKIALGKRRSNNSSFFNGQIQDLRIYNRILPEAERLTLYNE